MQEHELRVIAEKDELDMKISKLSSFLTSKIYFNLNRKEQDRLSYQYQIMKIYSTILDERILSF